MNESPISFRPKSIIRPIIALVGPTIFASVLCGQTDRLEFNLGLGQSRSQITDACGRPFGPYRVEASAPEAQIGEPIGLWSVYHLTPFQDRMYVTITHFDTASDKVDAVMLEPDGNWTVSQTLADHPELMKLCARSCQMEVLTNKAGFSSLALIPKDPTSRAAILLTGDTAGRWKSVTSMQSIVSWTYVVPIKSFRVRELEYKRQQLGNWRSQ